MAERDFKTGWSASGTLTTPAAGIPAPAPNKAVRLQVDFGEKRAEYYTLEFSLIQPPNIPGGVLLRGLAEINWAVEGNFIRREVQVLNGTAVSGIGQSVTIKIIDDSVDVGGLTTAIDYTASVQVAKGTRPNITHPPLYNPRVLDTSVGGVASFPPYNVEAGTVSFMPIPRNAGITSVFLLGNSPFALVTDPDDIAFCFRANGVQLAFANWNSLNTWLPLPPGTTDIECTNGHAGDVRVTPLYGIEG